MTPADDIATLLKQLKRIYKAHGLSYPKVAARLGICEKTMKRYMVGKGLTMTTFDRLCQVVGLTLLDLAEIVNRQRDDFPPMGERLEELLTRDLFSALVFSLLLRGWKADQIIHAMQLDPSEIIASLVKLDRLGVIRLYPENRVKVLATVRAAARNPQKGGAETIKKVMFRNLVRLVADDDPDLVWRMAVVRLTPERLVLVGRLFDELFDQIYAMEVRGDSEQDAAWFQMPLVAGPMNFDQVKPVRTRIGADRTQGDKSGRDAAHG